MAQPRQQRVELWLESRGSSKAWLARELGISSSRLYSYLSGEVRVPLVVVKRVHLLSKGAVSLFDWESPDLEGQNC